MYWNDWLERLELTLMLIISIKVDRPNHNLCLIKTKFKSRTSSYFHFVSSLFFIGSRIFLEFKAPFDSFILCYPQSYKKPQNILGKGWLLYTAWLIQLKADEREKISMCQFLQMQLESVSTNSAVFTKYKPNFITLGTYP